MRSQQQSLRAGLLGLVAPDQVAERVLAHRHSCCAHPLGHGSVRIAQRGSGKAAGQPIRLLAEAGQRVAALHDDMRISVVGHRGSTMSYQWTTQSSALRPRPYLTLAPWSIHAPSSARSASVMPVLLLNGMVLVTTARSLIRAAMRWICSGVSNITPAGATVKVASVGVAEWHSMQRRWITAC